MPKCNWKESHDVSVNGILNVEGDVIKVEIEDIGTKSLAEIVKKFNGCPVSIKVKEAIERYTAE